MAKKYTVYTSTCNLAVISNEKPIYENGTVVLVKLSGNEITFQRDNIIAIDEADYNEGEKINAVEA